VVSNGVVRQTRAVEVEDWGVHFVAEASLKAIETELLVMSLGKFVPEIVKLSPPRRLMVLVGMRPVTVHWIAWGVSEALFGITPSLAVKIGR